MLKLEDLGKPTDFWNYFNEISRIPRKSRFEDKIRIFIKNEAEKYGFIVQIDEIGNIAVKIPAFSGNLDGNELIKFQLSLPIPSYRI